MSAKKTSYYQRNQARLQAYQLGYARQKRAPGRRKVSKAERQLLEEQYGAKQSLMEAEGAYKTMSAAISQGYTCALILRSRAVDPRRTEGMAEREEDARQHFEELKDILSRLSPRSWKKDFKLHVDKFIADRLNERDVVIAIPGVNEEEELDRIVLYGLRRLVAGATQEWELAQQPKHAASCAKLEGALVWLGRGVNLRTFRQLYGW